VRESFHANAGAAQVDIPALLLAVSRIASCCVSRARSNADSVATTNDSCEFSPQGNHELTRLNRMAMMNSMFASKEGVVEVSKRGAKALKAAGQSAATAGEARG